MRTAGQPIAIAFILAILTVGSAVARAGGSGVLGARAAESCADESSRDAPNEASPLIVTGDFNRDGVADIAEVVSSGCEATERSLLTILLGQRDGTFKQAATSSIASRNPRAIVVGDFNGDGNPDLIVGDGDGSLIEFLGDGRGQLVPFGQIAHFGSIVSIAMGDFNHDGHLDLAVSDAQASSVTVLQGAGNGSFQQAWSFPLPMRGIDFYIAAADFNGDGIIDLAVTNDDDASYEIMLGNGNGTFTFAPTLSNVMDPNSHCPA
jgi:hypothetical protein